MFFLLVHDYLRLDSLKYSQEFLPWFRAIIHQRDFFYPKVSLSLVGYIVDISLSLVGYIVDSSLSLVGYIVDISLSLVGYIVDISLSLVEYILDS